MAALKQFSANPACRYCFGILPLATAVKPKHTQPTVQLILDKV